ncbi:MAG: hypothetical protein MHMPM18_000996 [Marteilia pararefringens]
MVATDIRNSKPQTSHELPADNCPQPNSSHAALTKSQLDFLTKNFDVDERIVKIQTFLSLLENYEQILEEVERICSKNISEGSEVFEKLNRFTKTIFDKPLIFLERHFQHLTIDQFKIFVSFGKLHREYVMIFDKNNNVNNSRQNKRNKRILAVEKFTKQLCEDKVIEEIIADNPNLFFETTGYTINDYYKSQPQAKCLSDSFMNILESNLFDSQISCSRQIQKDNSPSACQKMLTTNFFPELIYQYVRGEAKIAFLERQLLNDNYYDKLEEIDDEEAYFKE